MQLPILDNITSLLGRFLDVQSRRAEVVAGNLANVDTPGYIAKELDFDNYLRNAAAESLTPPGKQQNAPLAELSVVTQQPTTIGIDGNTVDAGHEMSVLAEAGTKYLQGTQLLQMRLRSLRTAIREGK